MLKFYEKLELKPGRKYYSKDVIKSVIAKSGDDSDKHPRIGYYRTVLAPPTMARISSSISPSLASSLLSA
jgi:hypothetical protein